MCTSCMANHTWIDIIPLTVVPAMTLGMHCPEVQADWSALPCLKSEQQHSLQAKSAAQHGSLPVCQQTATQVCTVGWADAHWAATAYTTTDKLDSQL